MIPEIIEQMLSPPAELVILTGISTYEVNTEIQTKAVIVEARIRTCST